MIKDLLSNIYLLIKKNTCWQCKLNRPNFIEVLVLPDNEIGAFSVFPFVMALTKRVFFFSVASSVYPGRHGYQTSDLP